ncbi:unnamed protein product, partial [Phaeothamnion confervicola]
MHFLADEHIPASVIATLRNAGHDVTSASKTLQGLPDTVLVAVAARDHMVILTEDEDFTARVREAAVASEPLPLALIHYRLDGMARVSKMSRMIDAVSEIGNFETETVYSVEPTR